MKKTVIALAGNPNSGKTTLFNQLTGSNQYVGNWPGVTVEKKEGHLKSNPDLIIRDLPGIYSLSANSLEEQIASRELTQNPPDLLINIIDGTNLERNLYLTMQLRDLGIPMVVAVNMLDVLKKDGSSISLDLLAKRLACPVVGISALHGTNLPALISEALQLTKGQEASSLRYESKLEDLLQKVQSLLPAETPAEQSRYWALRVMENREAVKLSPESAQKISELVAAYEKQEDDDIQSLITSARYGLVDQVVEDVFTSGKKESLSVSDKIDRVVTNRYLALPIFAAIIVLIYGVAISTVGKWATEWTTEVFFGEMVPGWVGGLLEAWSVAPWLQSLILDGIIAGVGAVLGFVPQIIILFLMLAFLEGSGYMARVAFILDRIFRRFGLSGKSFIPMLIGTGCGVPGIMASRTIEEERDRRMTVMLTTFVPCSAKLPVIALIAGALFGGAWWVSPSIYFLGIGSVIVSGIMLKKSAPFAGPPAPFVMELPAYHWPTLGNILRPTWERAWSFIRKAGTIILLSSVLVWFLAKVGFVDGHFAFVENLNDGLLATLGNAIAWIFHPLGWADWRSASATIMGLVAKENVVNTFGILFGNLASVSEAGEEIWGQVAAQYSAIAAYSFLVFNMLCAPCFAAMGAIKREMNNSKWTAFALLYQTVYAYAISLIIYQIGSLIINGSFGFWTVVAFLVLGGMLFQIFRPEKKYSSVQVAASSMAK